VKRASISLKTDHNFGHFVEQLKILRKLPDGCCQMSLSEPGKASTGLLPRDASPEQHL
jgi:hypothetical protein